MEDLFCKYQWILGGDQGATLVFLQEVMWVYLRVVSNDIYVIHDTHNMRLNDCGLYAQIRYK